jgi:hypothetical protein
MNEDAILIMIPLVMGALALGFDRPVARALSWNSSQIGDLFRKRRMWGTLAKPPDPQTSYKNFLFFVRLWGASMAALGMGLAITFLFGN